MKGSGRGLVEEIVSFAWKTDDTNHNKNGNRRTEARSRYHFCCGKAISITHSDCVYSLRYTACNTHAPYCHLWPALLYHIFPHYLINGTIFGGE